MWESMNILYNLMISGLRAPLRPGFDGRQRVGRRIQRRVAAPVGRLQGTALQHAAEVALQVQRIEKRTQNARLLKKIEGCAMSKKSVVTDLYLPQKDQ